jgi:IstB-like ATP binding protein
MKRTGFSAPTGTYTCPSVLVVDELRCLPLDQASADWIFPMVSHRYEKASIVLTTTVVSVSGTTSGQSRVARGGTGVYYGVCVVANLCVPAAASTLRARSGPAAAPTSTRCARRLGRPAWSRARSHFRPRCGKGSLLSSEPGGEARTPSCVALGQPLFGSSHIRLLSTPADP